MGQHCQGLKNTAAGPKSAEGGLGELKRKGLGRKGKGTASPPPPYLDEPPVPLPFPYLGEHHRRLGSISPISLSSPLVSLVWGFYM